MTRQFLIDTLWPHRLVVAAVVLLSALASLFDALSIAVLVPLLARLQQLDAREAAIGFAWIRPLLSDPSPRGLVYWSIGVVLGATVLKNLLSSLAMRIGHWLSTKLLADLRMKAVSSLLRASMAFHHRSRLGDLMDKTITGTFTAEGVIRIGMEFTACAITLFVLLAVLVVLSWQLTLAAIPLAVVFGLWMRRHSRTLLRLGKSVADANRSVVGSMYESVAGIALIKSYSQEERHLQRLTDAVEASRRLEGRRRFQMFWIHPATDLAGTLAMALLVVVALETGGANTPAMLTRLLPFLFVLVRLVPLVKILNGQRTELIAQWGLLGMLVDILRTDDKGLLRDGETRFGTLTTGIEFRNVTLSYDDQVRPALDDVSFRIPAGQTTAVIGESGAGKSTVAALLLRLVDPGAGTILVDGTPLTELTLASYHAAVGVVSQDTFLFNDTVRYNITFAANGPIGEAALVAAARQAGAHDFIMELPSGYDTLLGDRGVRLSGGQRQRIAIARAIVRQPQILIFDEATSALDAATERRIHDALREVSRDRTVVIIAHRPSSIEEAHWIVELEGGRVKRTGARIRSGEPFEKAIVHGSAHGNE